MHTEQLPNSDWLSSYKLSAISTLIRYFFIKKNHQNKKSHEINRKFIIQPKNSSIHISIGLFVSNFTVDATRNKAGDLKCCSVCNLTAEFM